MKRQLLRNSIALLFLVTLAGCGDGSPGPTGPTGQQSFLAGTWRGTMTIQPNPTAPQPPSPVTGAVTWTFEVVPQNGFTLRWFGILSHPDFLSAVWMSLLIAVIATVVSLVCGTLAALALARSAFRGREFIKK